MSNTSPPMFENDRTLKIVGIVVGLIFQALAIGFGVQTSIESKFEKQIGTANSHYSVLQERVTEIEIELARRGGIIENAKASLEALQADAAGGSAELRELRGIVRDIEQNYTSLWRETQKLKQELRNSRVPK